MAESFAEYIMAVLKYWKWLLIDWILALISGLSTLTEKPIPLGIPLAITLALVGLIVAQFLAFHDLRKRKASLEDELKNAKRYQDQSQRIEIISKEKYPSEILRIFDDMRRCLNEIIESGDTVENVTGEKISSVMHGSPRDLARALNQKTIDDNIHVTYCFYQNFRAGIGLIDLQNNNKKWLDLCEQLETIKKDIPDQKLKDSVNSHFEAMNGEASIRLHYRYMAKYGTNQYILQVVKPFRPIRGLTDETLTRVSKRIVDLKLGEEPQWEMKHFKMEME